MNVKRGEEEKKAMLQEREIGVFCNYSVPWFLLQLAGWGNDPSGKRKCPGNKCLLESP